MFSLDYFFVLCRGLWKNGKIRLKGAEKTAKNPHAVALGKLGGKKGGPFGFKRSFVCGNLLIMWFLALLGLFCQ